MAERKTLPGFELLIETETPEQEVQTAVKDVIVIYAIMPDTLSYEDEDGVIYNKYIEPLKPIIITSRDKAIQTLETSNLQLTREIKNIINLAPTNSTIALCKIVKRDGTNPDPKNLQDMYEALDFAFEATENYPIKQVVLADISLDKAVKNKPFQKIVEYNEKSSKAFSETSVLNIIGDIVDKNGNKEIQKNVQFDFKIVAKRDNTSKEEQDGLGIFSDVDFLINGEVAKCITGTSEESLKPMSFKIVAEYHPETGTDPEEKVQVNSLTSPTSNPKNKIAIVGKKMQLTLGEDFKLKIDDEHSLEIKQGIIEFNNLGQADLGEENAQEVLVHIGKNSANCHILLRTLLHVHTITTTKNNCMLIMSPEPPKNQSSSSKKEYIARLQLLAERVKEVTYQTIKGRALDLGMYLTIPVGSNRVDGIGGLFGFPQSTIKTIDGASLTTVKLTLSFEIGDKVEIFTYDKLDIKAISAIVKSVKANEDGTTTITLDKEIPLEIKNNSIPKYIVNVNNKDFNGNYMVMQWASVIEKAGLDRSPEGIPWEGECQLAFSSKELDTLNALKYAVLDQIVGTTQGSISRSQLMSGSKTQFQDVENLIAVYALTSGAKEIGNKYLGDRFDDTADLALVRTELEDAVFKPAVGRYIKAGYKLELALLNLPEKSTGRTLKALEMYFEATEIKTLKLLRIRARLK